MSLETEGQDLLKVFNSVDGFKLSSKQRVKIEMKIDKLSLKRCKYKRHVILSKYKATKIIQK